MVLRGPGGALAGLLLLNRDLKARLEETRWAAAHYSAALDVERTPGPRSAADVDEEVDLGLYEVRAEPVGDAATLPSWRFTSDVASHMDGRGFKDAPELGAVELDVLRQQLVEWEPFQLGEIGEACQAWCRHQKQLARQKIVGGPRPGGSYPDHFSRRATV